MASQTVLKTAAYGSRGSNPLASAIINLEKKTMLKCPVCETAVLEHEKNDCLYIWLLLIDQPGEFEWRHTPKDEEEFDDNKYQLRFHPEYQKKIFPDEPDQWENDWWGSSWETQGPDWTGPWAQAGGYLEEMKASIYHMANKDLWEVLYGDAVSYRVRIEDKSPTLAIFKTYLLWKENND